MQPELFFVAVDAARGDDQRAPRIIGSNAGVLEFYDRQGYERFEVGLTGKRLIPD